MSLTDNLDDQHAQLTAIQAAEAELTDETLSITSG